MSRIPGIYNRKAVVFQVNYYELVVRMKNREEETGKSIPIKILDWMISQYEEPSEEEKFSDIQYMSKVVCIKSTKYPREDYMLGNSYEYYHSSNNEYFFVVNNYNLACSFEYNEFSTYFINERKFKLLKIDKLSNLK